MQKIPHSQSFIYWGFLGRNRKSSSFFSSFSFFFFFSFPSCFSFSAQRKGRKDAQGGRLADRAIELLLFVSPLSRQKIMRMTSLSLFFSVCVSILFFLFFLSFPFSLLSSSPFSSPSDSPCCWFLILFFSATAEAKTSYSVIPGHPLKQFVSSSQRVSQQ